MAREIEEYEEVKSFIQDVTEQIQYRPIRPEIKEELLSHIEDRVDEYENAGESRDNAIKTTVLQMGEPVNIGMSLNEVRRTRDNWWGIGFGIFTIMLAASGCMREWSEKGLVHGLFRTFYLPMGIGLFVFFYLKGYEMLVKKTKVILYVLCGIIALEAIILLLRKLSIVTQYNVFSRRIYPILFSPSVVGSILLVIVPLIVIVIYGIRLRGKIAILLAYITMELFLILSGLHLGFRIVTNELIAIFTLIIILGIMIGKDILKGKKKQLWIWYCIGAVSLLGSYGYGWIIGGALIVVVAAFYISLTVISARIKNQLAKMLSISCSVCLLLQFILYMLSNLGYLYGNSVNLPLISDGLCSIIVNTILFACILGAYRYDHVWNYWDYTRKVTY